MKRPITISRREKDLLTSMRLDSKPGRDIAKGMRDRLERAGLIEQIGTRWMLTEAGRESL